MLRVRVLGPVHAEADGRPVPEPGSRRAVALLGWLALHPGLHSRADVAARLWPDVVDVSARQSMRSAVWALRRSLDELDPGALVTTRDRIGLRADTAVDVVEFDRLVRAGEPTTAVELATGDLLAGVDDEWALIARDEHRLWLGTVLAKLAEQADDAATAVRWARRAAALDPLSEESGRLLMSCLAAAGDRPAAMVVYQKLADRLRRELRVAPSEPTWRLAEQIRTEVPATPSVRTRRGLLPLVGRDREFGELRAAWAATMRSGHGGLAVVHGDPGIGKTRLATQLAELAAHDGAAVAAGAAADLAGPPLAPWAEIGAALIRRLGELPDAPWVAALAPMLPAHVPATYGEQPPALVQARLAEAVVALVHEVALRWPVLVVLEDLHAADEASLALLSYVVRRVADARVLVVTTRRERPVRDLVVTLEHTSRQAGTTHADTALGPLNRSAISDLARAVGTLTDDAVAQVVDAADGNALLAVEAARALTAGDPAPAGLRGAVRAAVARLPEEARELVRTLAVAGRELALTDLAGRTGLAVAEALPPAEDQGLLETVDGRVRYRHDLLRDAVYADLPSVERAERHARAAEHLAGSMDRAAEAAAHLRAAGRVHEAGQLLLFAAVHARALGALSDATELLREASIVLPDDPAAALALADVLACRGRPADARSAFAKALPLVERAGDPAALAAAHLRFAEWHYGPICQPAVAVEACRRALAVMDGAGVDVPQLRARILAVAAHCESLGGELAEVERALAALHELVGPEPGDPLLGCIAHCAECFSFLRAGRFAEAVECGVRGGERALEANRPDLVQNGWGNAAFAEAAAGNLAGALELLDRTLGAVRGRGLLAIEANVLVERSWLLDRLGRVAEAVESAAQARRTADQLDAPDLRALVDAERGRIALRAGDYPAAVGFLGDALAVPEAMIGRPLARLQRAEALARVGDLDAAEAELGEVVLEPVRPGDWPETLVPRLVGVEGLIAAGRCDRARARRCLREAADGWRRQLGTVEIGQRIGDVMIDLGRVIIGLVVPAEELAAVEADLDSLIEFSDV